MVAQFVLRSLSHELACRLAKRHGLQNPKDANDWQMAEKARTLYKKADAAALAVLIFEAMLISPAGSASANKDDDPLADAAASTRSIRRHCALPLPKPRKRKRAEKEQSDQQKGENRAQIKDRLAINATARPNGAVLHRTAPFSSLSLTSENPRHQEAPRLRAQL